jgi:uncharacterized protein (TIGR00290 family)
MTLKKKVYVSWSGGRDSTLLLEKALEDEQFEVVGLLTTFHEQTQTSVSHEVPKKIMDQQAKSLGISLLPVWFNVEVTNEVYNQKMKALHEELHRNGVQAVLFGDLFIEDIKAYREKQMADTPIMPLFPLWGMDSKVLPHVFLKKGYKATIIAVDEKRLPASWVGKAYDSKFLDQLPAGVDHSGENGEFHTLVTEGPIFREPLELQIGGMTKGEYYTYVEWK